MALKESYLLRYQFPQYVCGRDSGLTGSPYLSVHSARLFLELWGGDETGWLDCRTGSIVATVVDALVVCVNGIG